jgi:murein DD-endopeptidase MepM/ murein hydrolase activator NlpD
MVDTFNQLFRDRHFLIRSEQGTTQFRFRRRHQIILASIVSGVMVWAVAATTAFTVAAFRVSDQASQIEDLEIGYATLIADISRRSSDSFATAVDLARQDGMTERLLARNGELENEVGQLRQRIETLSEVRVRLQEEGDALAAEVATLTEERDLAFVENDQLLNQIAQIEAEIATAYEEREAALDDSQRLRLDVSGLNNRLDYVQNWNETLSSQIDQLSDSVTRARARVSALESERDSLESELRTAYSRLSTERQRTAQLEILLRDAQLAAVELSTERNALLDARGHLLGEVGQLQAELEGLEQYQELVFARLRQTTDGHVASLEEGLAMTGLDIDALLEEVASLPVDGAGGPLVPLIDDYIAGQPGWIDAVQTIMSTDRMSALSLLATRLPIGYPVVDDHRLVSSFGPRSDPFTGSLAMHEGIDFAGPRGTPIHVSGPGVVVHADWRNGYGNTVEIDHGFGLITRYAHLQRILVEDGQEVDYHDQIGLMGSTGRSTGSHLHYEVLVDRQPIDPINFIRAGQHVFEVADRL